MVGYNTDGPARDRVLKLMEEKDKIESEIREQSLILEVNNNVGMSEPLVDAEGYPRNDIDVYKVRHARHRIICLQKDHKNIMKKIERGLAEVHADFIPPQRSASTQGAGTSNTNSNATNSDTQVANITQGTRDVNINECFATVSFVTMGSPADLAGLCEGDEIIQFGSINHENFIDMNQIYDLVAHSVGQQIHVKVRRQQHVFNLDVVPRPWSQPGLLGCQIHIRVNP